jgi:glycosyltransferase involved in cell wall biosynthesis
VSIGHIDAALRGVGRPSDRPLRVLMIAFEFPPLATGGVYRALGLAELLPAHDIELEIVTVRPDDYRQWSTAPFDEGLLARVPANVRLHRIASGFPAWYWRVMRSRVGSKLLQFAMWGDPVSLFWRRPLRECLDRIVAERRPDVLLSTAPPFGVQVLAREAARRYRLPWVADWRDPWTFWRMAPFATWAHYRYVRAREAQALRDANLSVATSHVTRDEWRREFRSADPERLVTIYNGFDRAALAATPAAPPATPGIRSIVHVGHFYYEPSARDAMFRTGWKRPPHRWLFYSPRREDWLYRSPFFFLRGLRRFADRDPRAAASLRVRFAGGVPSWLPPMLHETGTTDLVELLGWIPHHEAAPLAKSADALLLTSARVLGGRDYSIAGKTFEYLGLGRPILGVLTDGAMRDLVARSGLGLLPDPDDADAVADAIARVAEGDGARIARDADTAFVSACARESTARRMADAVRRAAREGYRERRASPVAASRAAVDARPWDVEWLDGLTPDPVDVRVVTAPRRAVG